MPSVTHLLLFGGAFMTVFLLGFQQQNVIGRHYLAAIFVSFGISISQILLWKLVPTATISEIIGTMLGGAMGIVSAMYLHPRIFKKRRS